MASACLTPRLPLQASEHCSQSFTCSPDFLSGIVSNMRQLWQDELLLDYSIKTVDGQIFRVHKAYIASVSDYFKAMLTSSMLESRNDSVELKGVSSNGLAPILSYIYGGKLVINENNIGDILITATHLQIETAIEHCCQYFKDHIRINNALDILHFADVYSLYVVRDVVDKFILEHFQEFAAEEFHCQLSSEDMMKYVRSDSLRCGSEYRLYKNIIGWWDMDKDARHQPALEVMQHIRFPLMKKAELERIEQSECALCQQPSFKRLLEEAHSYKALQHSTQLLRQSRQTVIRNSPSLVAFSGDLDHETCSTNFYLLQDDHWMKLPCHMRQFSNASITVLHNFIFACGGYQNGYSITNQCYVYDPRYSKWSRMKPMNVNRVFFPLIAFDDAIYAIGGCREKQQINPFYLNTNTLEVYSPTQDTWSEVSQMDDKLRKHAACVIHRKMYVSGGLRENQMASDRMQCFDPQCGTWQQLTPMSNVRFSHSMVAVEDKAYVIDPIECEIEAYSPCTNQWTSIRINMGEFLMPILGRIVALNADIYFINGKTQVDGDEMDHICLHLDVQEGKISTLPNYPEDVTSPHCCVVCLPQEVIDSALSIDYPGI